MPDSSAKTNIVILTCKILPYFTNKQAQVPLSTEWLKEIINKKVREIWDEMIKKGGDPELFFNRDKVTNETKASRYPKIFYHIINGEFCVSGILKEQGVKSLEILASYLQSPFGENGVMFSEMKPDPQNSFETEIGVGDQIMFYKLKKWIPFHHNQNSSYKKLTYLQKAEYLNTKLYAQISNGFCRELNIKTDNLLVEIIDVTRVYPKVVYEKKKYKYSAFDIEFKTNINLPRFVTLGNMQAFGYGRVM